MVIIEKAYRIFTCATPVDKLIVQKTKCGYVLSCCSGEDLFVYTVNEENKESWSKAKLCFTCKLHSAAVELLCKDKNIYLVLYCGSVCRLESDESLEEEDMFDLEESIDAAKSWKVEPFCKLEEVDKVVAASIANFGICLIVKVLSGLSVIVVADGVISRIALNDGVGDRGCCCVVNISSLSLDFMNLWLPGVERSQEFLFVGLEDGGLICIPLCLPLRYYSVYNSVYSILSLSWFQDRSSHRFDALIMVSDLGAVTRLTPIGQETSFPFLPILKSVASFDQFVISLGEVETRFLLLSNAADRIITFPISGIVGVCTVNVNSKLILVSDNKSCLYLIDIDDISLFKESKKAKKDICTPLPLLNDLQLLIASSTELSETNKTLKCMDEYLRCKSLAARGDILKEYFHVSSRIVQVLGERYTIRIKIAFRLAGIILSKESWNLSLTFITMKGCKNHLVDLSEDISCERNSIRLVTVPLSFHLIYDIKCALVSRIHYNSVPIHLHLARMEMYATNLLFPPSLKELCNKDEDSIWTCDSGFRLEVPLIESFTNAECLIGLLSDSRAMWRISEWNRMIESQEATCILFGHSVFIKVNDNSISVESRDLKACQAVRLALSIKLKGDMTEDSKEKVAQCLMSWHQAENIIRLSKHPSTYVTDLYNILKNSIVL